MRDIVEVELSLLARAPVPPELAEIERRVLDSVDGVVGGASSGITRELRLAAAAGALIMGMAAGSLPSSEAYASASLTPLDGASALAPSSLLLAGS